MPTFIDASEADYRRRILGVALFVMVTFAAFGARVLHLQVFEYKKTYCFARDNYTSNQVILADKNCDL